MTAVRRVVVVGRDAELWLTALALQRALSPAGVTVEVVELASTLSEHDLYSAAPSLTGLHELLGLDRRDVLRVSRGIPVTGQRFAGWSETPFIYGYDSKRAAIANVDVLQYWVKLRAQGLTLPLDRLSVAAVAAGLGRVGPDGQSPADFGTVHRGYHLDARSYAAALRRLTQERGVVIHRGAGIEVERRGDEVQLLRLDGAEVAADLFVDASGADAVLASGQGDSQWESWGQHLPADRLMMSSAPPLNPTPPFADIRATEAGWVGVFPLMGRTAIMAALSSAHMERSAEAFLSEATGTNRLASPEIRELQPGARKAWTGNVVAIGSSAAAFPPLDLMQLHMAHVGVTNLIALFPAAREAMPEAQTYNGIVGRYARNVRDVMTAHYRLNSRVGDPLWDQARAGSGPDELDSRLSVFAARGLVPQFDDDSFDEGLWSYLLVGHGLIPRGYDRGVDRRSPDEVQSGLQRLIDVVEEKARAMPTVAAYLQS